MKYITVFLFFFLFVSCDCAKSVYIDKRCEKIHNEMWDKEENGACDLKPEYERKDEKGELHHLTDSYYKTLEKCNEFKREIGRRCDALPPPGPDDIQQLSGSSFGGC